MSKKKSTPTHARSRTRPGANQQPSRDKQDGAEEHKPWLTPAAVREIIESIAIAFVLAFLFRTFEAEAFVIPTGSMAPTLMGRHKDLECPECGFPFQVSASEEVDNKTNRRTGSQVIAGTCPNCRYTADLRDGNEAGKTYASYKGDRILVAKFPYQFGDPERWDVAVFKYPGEARTNYIKRIVGLPNEWIGIRHGDLFVQPAEDGRERPNDEAWVIAHKDPKKTIAMMQMVFDNDHLPDGSDGELPEDYVAKGWPLRWGPATAGAAGAWNASSDHRSFTTDGTAEGPVWLRYQHRVLLQQDWERLREHGLGPDDVPPPLLISDFAGYNTQEDSLPMGLHGQQLGLHWVGDLGVECELEVQSESGHALFELVEGGRRFRCAIDVADGAATLSIDGVDPAAFGPTGATAVRGPGTHDVRFVNFDDKLTLWVDGRVVPFDGPTAYGPLDNNRPTRDDLEPVRIGSDGAKLGVSHVKLFRDIYYISDKLGPGQYNGPLVTDWDRLNSPYVYAEWTARGPSARAVARVLADPARYNQGVPRSNVNFVLRDDQFLVFGDNSAQSKDSRLWSSDGPPYYVGRELLTGKALVIYWPHSLDRIPGTNIPIRFFPNFWRMWIVR